MNSARGHGTNRPTLSLLIVLLIGLSSTAPTDSYGQADPDPRRFDGEIAAFRMWDSKNVSPESPILFVGSSSIRMWATAHLFPDRPVVNRGFGGSHISDVIFFIDDTVLRYRPRTIVFYAGDNDVADGKSAEQVRDDFVHFARLVHDRLPHTRIFFVAIKPSLDRWSMWSTMREANRLIAATCNDDPLLHYIDIATPMLVDGEPSPDLFVDDGLHLNENGYRLWTDIVAKALQGVDATK